MKRLTFIIASWAIVFAMASCDKLNEPYFTESPIQISDTIQLDPDDYTSFDGKIVVLLEDFTGVKCVNCPNAAAIANDLSEQYEGHIVVLGVHPDSPFTYQNPEGGFPDFRTADGEVWRQQFGIESFPNGLINRANPLPETGWASAVANVIDNDAPAMLVVKSAYDDATRELKLSIHTIFHTDVSGDIRLTTCIMEDKLIGKQVTSSGVNNEYVHRHVFRGTADNIAWGRVMDDELETIPAESYYVTNMKFTLNSDYNDEEVYIVAFISNNDTKQVLMAAEKKIK